MPGAFSLLGPALQATQVGGSRLRREVIDELADADRPVNHVDTGAPVKVTYTAEGIKVTAPLSAAHKIVTSKHPASGWQIVIRTDDEPTIDYQ